jgi:hypothetical protein
MHNEFGFRGAALLVGASLVALISSKPAQAQPVTLRSSDGSVTISAPLLSFDGNAHKIKIGAHDELTRPVSDFFAFPSHVLAHMRSAFTGQIQLGPR